MATIVWGLDDPVRSAEHRQALVGEAWRRWEIASCEEWTSGHAWLLDLETYDGQTIHLGCEHCPAGIDDIAPDGHELMGGWFEDLGVTVRHGGHDSLVPLLIPVDVDVWASRMWTDYGYEYDAGVDLYQRCPAQPLSNNQSKGD